MTATARTRLAAMSLTAVGLLGLAALSAPAPAMSAPTDPTRPTIRYDLTGAGLARYITYQTNDGQSHATNVPLPWSVQLTGWMTSADSPSPYALSAQSVGPGVLTCTVRINDKVVSTNTATGDPARVLCENHGQHS